MSRYEYWQSEPLSLCPGGLTNAYKTSERQRRLCACYLVRQIIWDIIADDLKKVIEVSESFADGEIERKQYFAITRAARRPYKELCDRCFLPDREVIAEEQWLYHAVNSVDCTTAPKFSPTTLRVAASQVWETVRWWMEAKRKKRREKSDMTLAVKDKFGRGIAEFS